MRLIVDTSRIIAALIKDSASRAILLSDKFEFLTVNFTKLEIEVHKKEIMEKGKISENESNLVLSLLLSHVQIISDIAIESKLEEAKEIMRVLIMMMLHLLQLPLLWTTKEYGLTMRQLLDQTP